ncbi:MAG: dihydrodipicolinate synthase family protein [SAR202 cluster bacterium]|jgi:dihydrodipicolinate synthase/N-acetylneuraminate lyase|nr:dihydrodipicolinate synthase family protein [SAR202 cluster bacterium]
MLTAEQAKNWFKGVTVPLATIFHKDGSLDLESTASNVQWLVDQGARQGNTILLTAGSGGDFTSLNTEERKQVIGAVAKIAAGKIPTIASVQSTDIRVTIELSQYCEEVGIDAVQMSGAYYYDGRPEDVIDWVEEVARHTKVGFAAYSHWYSGSKYDLPIDVVERLLDLPNTIAVKWASPVIESFIEGVQTFEPRVAVIDNGPIPIFGHILGCKAFISHVPNYYPHHAWKVWDLMEAQRYQEAQKLYDEFMVPYMDLVGKVAAATAGEGVFVRPGLEAAGLPTGYSRLPSRDAAITDEVRDGFKRLLESQED